MIIKMKPVFKDYIWGGSKLKTLWGKSCGEGIVAESWELSTHKDGSSTALSGLYDNKKLSEIISPKIVGKNAAKFDRFPLLIKLIDAQQKLSVQVHPSDAYALKNEGDLGKSEMWYIADAEKGAGIYCGFKEGIKKEQIEQLVQSGELEQALNFIPVKKGDSFFIPDGTVHAIGAGLTICEVQQNSNVTYRLYDYGRKDAMGATRQLHIQKALDVLSVAPYKNQKKQLVQRSENLANTLIAQHPYFRVYECKLKTSVLFEADENSFCSLVFLQGEGEIGDQAFQKGDTFFVSAGQTFLVNAHKKTVFLYVDIPS